MILHEDSTVGNVPKDIGGDPIPTPPDLDQAMRRASLLINQMSKAIKHMSDVDFAALNEHWIYAERYGYK